MRNTNEIESDKSIIALVLLWAYSEEENTGWVDSDIVKDVVKNVSDESITGKILKLRIPNVFGFPITPPDWLIFCIETCTNDSPGYSQIIYKELLEYINNAHYGGMGLPPTYKIKVTDFTDCFKVYPIIDIPEIEEKYSKLWDEQKVKHPLPGQTDNRCDTPRYWNELIFTE